MLRERGNYPTKSTIKAHIFIDVRKHVKERHGPTMQYDPVKSSAA